MTQLQRNTVCLLMACFSLFGIQIGSTALAQMPEIYATIDASTPPGNIAIGPDGRIFLSVHGFYGQPVKVVELMPDGSTRPYPNEAWAHAPKSPQSPEGLYGVLGLNVDREGVLWLLDGQGPENAGRLVGWDTKEEQLHQVVYLVAPATRPESFLNDLAVDRKHGFVYIADTASSETAAVIVVNLQTGETRRVLEGSESTRSEDIDMVIDGRVIALGDQPARLGINPITIDPANQYVYYGAMSGTAVYRVATSDLQDVSLTPAELEERVERYGDKPISDGITVDGGGNVYITSITDDSIGVVKPDGSYHTLFKHDSLSWPDGFAYGPDHKVYATINELHRSPPLNGGENEAKGEFKVVRFDALVEGASGR